MAAIVHWELAGSIGVFRHPWCLRAQGVVVTMHSHSSLAASPLYDGNITEIHAGGAEIPQEAEP